MAEIVQRNRRMTAIEYINMIEEKRGKNMNRYTIVMHDGEGINLVVDNRTLLNEQVEIVRINDPEDAYKLKVSRV